ncbi:MAG TPA: DPP IV N-terminal domain-containing protein [Mycobacteriales bacterium]|nr:DPP IV N-terminal domain-containing protein [Mycobacteriales bacterium]
MTNEARDSVYQAYLRYGDLIRGWRVTPGWIVAGPSFWYAEGGANDRTMWVVDPVANTREPLFDVERLRKSLSVALGEEPAGAGVPFEWVQFVSPQHLMFNLGVDMWLFDLDSYSAVRQPAPASLELSTTLVSEAGRAMPAMVAHELFSGLGAMKLPERPSPDGQWFASTQHNNVAVRATIDGKTVMLTTDGTDECFWDVEPVKWSAWSPDSQRLAVFKTDTSGMARIPTIHWLKRLPQVEEVLTLPAGGVINRNELYLVDINGRAPLHVDLGDTTDQYLVVLGWRPDSSEVLVARYDRLFSRVEILAVDAKTGEPRTVMIERSATWLTNHHFALWGVDTGFWMLPDGSGFLWRSERDGWAHLYHYDIDGALVAQLTQGQLPVIGVTHIDQLNGWVYFQAHGDADRPYDNHLYRVAFDGGEHQQLTEGNGRHEIAFAPTGDFFLDTFSSVGTAPRTVLRSADGQLLQTLAEADISRLEQVGFVPSKEYVVKAADGETDLWVTLHFPYDFDPAKKYPVVEHIYGGPQTINRVMDFGAALIPPDAADIINYPRALAQQGFIVLTMDGRGTPGRSKAFHDTIYRNWGSFEIADHAGAIRQLAERESFIDVERVAITGGSWGGHYTFRALVQAPDVYKFGIAEVPGYDSRTFTLYEPYLGMPSDNKDLYDAADAIRLAPMLQGKLLQTGALNDTGTAGDFFRMSEALVRAGIQHDEMVYPNASHGYLGASGRYNLRLKTDWFLRHLQPGSGS